MDEVRIWLENGARGLRNRLLCDDDLQAAKRGAAQALSLPVPASPWGSKGERVARRLVRIEERAKVLVSTAKAIGDFRAVSFLFDDESKGQSARRAA